MSNKTNEVLGYLDDKLKQSVTEALAAVMTEQRDDPMRHLAQLLKAQSMGQVELQPPITVSVPTGSSDASKSPPIDVTLRHVSPKTELMLPKQMLYGLHMPSHRQLQMMLDYISDEHHDMSRLILIVEREDPGKDLMFIDGTPYYGDLTEKRAERRRKILRENALNSANVSRLEQSVLNTAGSSLNLRTVSNAQAQRTSEWVKGGGSAVATRKRGASVVTLADGTDGGLDDTQRPKAKGVTEDASAASAGAAASAFQRTLSDVSGPQTRRRGRSMQSIPSFEALRSALRIAASAAATVAAIKKKVSIRDVGEESEREVLYQQLTDILGAVKPSERAYTIEDHTINPTESMADPIALYERIDGILGVVDRDDVQPVLVVSYRSREFDWRRLMTVVNATQKPLIEFKRLRETAMIEATTTHKRFTMSSGNNEDYWAEVAKRRVERDAKRKALAASREATLAAYKAERLAQAIAERAEAAAAAAANGATANGNNATSSATMSGTNLGATYSGHALASTMSAGMVAKAQKDPVLPPDEFEQNHVAETQRRLRIDAIREKRRQREDVIFDRLLESERAKKAVKLQALIRGYLSRRANRQQHVMESTSGVFLLPSGGGGNNSGSGEGFGGGGGHRPSVGMGMGVDGSTRIDAPALMRRVYLKANESMAGLLTTKLPMPKSSAIRHEFWVPRRVHVAPRYEGDVSSDEEYFDQHTVTVPPRSDTRRPVLFNALLRLQEVSREVGDDLYEWAVLVQKQFVGVSRLQQRAYDALKASSLDLIHIVFLEAHHRRLYTQSTLRADSSFSDYIAADFFELTSWFSSPHFMSLSTAPGVASALQYGPQNPMYDHVLYASGDPKTLPWGGEAPPNPAVTDDHKLFMAHWSENAHQLVSTTVDFTSAKVFLKQIEYATLSGLPCWWFSISPHLGVYVNNQPFIAVRRPTFQEVDGCDMYNQLHSSVKDAPAMHSGGGGGVGGADKAASSLRRGCHSPIPGVSPSESPGQRSLVGAGSPLSRGASMYDPSAGAASFKFENPSANAPDHTPTATKGIDSMTFSYAEGASIRLRTWFGVHWTEMERKFRNRVASLAANNKYHVPAFVMPVLAPPPGAKKPEGSNKSSQGITAKDDALSVNSSNNSKDSKVRPFDENINAPSDAVDLVGYGKDFTWLDDSHAFAGTPCFTESAAALKTVQTLTNMIPPPRPPPPRNLDADMNETSMRRRTFSRNNSTRNRGSSLETSRSMRRLQSVQSMRMANAQGAASRASSIMGDRIMDNSRMSLATTAAAPVDPNATTPQNVLQRVRTSNSIAGKLFKHPQSRYIRSPGLEVSGYQWWCNLDQFISLVHKGLKAKAGIVIGITDEAQVFYSLVAQLVAHACYSSEDDVYKIYRMEQTRIKEEADRVVKEAEVEKVKNFDPDNLASDAAKKGGGGLGVARLDPDDLVNDVSIISSISDDDDDEYVSAKDMLGLNRKDPLMDISFTNAGAGLVPGAESKAVDNNPLAFLNMFAAICEPMCNGGRSDAIRAWAAFNYFVRCGAGTYFITSLTRDIEMAERAEALKDVRHCITRACRTSERYASLFLVYLFLRSLPPGEGTEETPSIVAWLFNPKYAKMMEWLNAIDPWAHCPGRSPDPNHTRYSSIYRRWTEDAFITAIH